MKIIRYGVTLKRLTQEYIELVREKRNNVRHLMHYQEYITPEMQQKWFESIDTPENMYYLIEYKGTFYGMINEKDIDHENGKMESGIFLFEEEYYNSIIPVLASLILIESGFYIVKGGASHIRVMRDNKKAIDYNISLGYELCEGQENEENQLYRLTVENFEKKAKKLRKAALHLGGGDNSLTLILEPRDYELGVAQIMENIANRNGIVPTKDDSGNTLVFIKDIPT